MRRVYNITKCIIIFKNTGIIQMKFYKLISFLFILLFLVQYNVYANKRSQSNPVIDADYPGGNIFTYTLSGKTVLNDTVYLFQELRDTEWWWFYWNFRVRGAENKTLHFKFCLPHPRLGILPFGTHGPAVSVDGGGTWSWLGRNVIKDDVFSYSFAPAAKEVRFCFTIPYQQSHLDTFKNRHKYNPHLLIKELCKTRKGRVVDQLQVGKTDSEPKYRILLTARHHACESIASYVLEGILEAALANNSAGQWFRENVEILAIPIMDTDGVEDGDQGKSREPHDHNRDYEGESIYPSVSNLRRLVPNWSQGKLRIAIDLHCPYLDTPFIYFVDPAEGDQACNKKFREILTQVQVGPLIFENDEHRISSGKRLMKGWAAGLPGVEVASTIEIPYGNAYDVVVTAESARLFGHDLARAMKAYLQE